MNKTPYSEINDQIDSAINAEKSSKELLESSRNQMREAMHSLRIRSGLTCRAFGSLGGVSKAYVYSTRLIKRKLPPCPTLEKI
jgi:hypothetical protein